MGYALAAMLLTLAPQDSGGDRVPLKWKAQKGDTFQVKWKYEESADVKYTSPNYSPYTETDRRDVEMTWTALSDVEGTAPSKDGEGIAVEMQKGSWTIGTKEYEATVTYQKGQDPKSSWKAKINDAAKKSAIEKTALDKLEEMKAAFSSSYKVVAEPSGGVFIASKDSKAGFFKPCLTSAPESTAKSGEKLSADAFDLPLRAPDLKEWKKAPTTSVSVDKSKATFATRGSTNWSETTTVMKGMPKVTNTGSAQVDGEIVFSLDGYVSSAKRTYKQSYAVSGSQSSGKSESYVLTQSLDVNKNR